MHIWDEFPMCHWKVFEAVSRCLCDLKQTTAPGSDRVFICCGDFSQIPPVIPSGGRRAIIEATIKLSPLWESFQLRELTHSQRGAGDTATPTLWTSSVLADFQPLMPLPRQQSWCAWNHWQLPPMRMKPSALRFPTSTMHVHQCSQRAIITGNNHVIDALNKKILTMLHEEEFSLFSVTWLCSNDTRMQNLISTEFLNSLRSPGVPEQELKLKLNCLCMVTRKILVQDRLMNNTKVIVREKAAK